MLIKSGIFSAAVLLCLAFPLFSNITVEKESLKKTYSNYKKYDSLSSYLDHLFDYIDANPTVVIAADDSLMKTIWRVPNGFDEKLSYYSLLTNIAYHLLQYRQVPASIKWYEKAYQFYEQNKADSALEAEMYFEEYICKPLGNNYTRMGDFSGAVFIQKTAIRSAQQKQLYDILPGLYGNLATSYFHAQQYDSVQHYINEGIQKTRADHPQILNLYNLKAGAYLENGYKDSAVFWNGKAMRISGRFEKLNPDAVIVTFLDKARILNQSKDHTGAIKFLHRAWEMAPEKNIAEKVEIAIEAGNAFLLANKPDSSISWHQTALSFFKPNQEGLFPDFKVTTALFGIATGLLYANPDTAAPWFEKAVLNDYFTQQLLPTSTNSRTAAYANSRYSEVAIALHHQLFEQTGNNEYLLKAMWLAELSKGRQLLTEQRRSREWENDSILQKNKALADELKSLHRSLAESSGREIEERIRDKIQMLEHSLKLTESGYSRMLKAPSYNEFKKWVSATGPQTRVLSYYWGQSYVYCVSIHENRYKNFLDTAILDRERYLAGFVDEYFYKGPEAFNNAPGSYYKRSNQLLQQWIPKQENAAPNILISADGPLHSLPFEALCIDSLAPAYFGEQVAVAYSFSLLQNIEARVASEEKARITIFSFEEPHLGFAALPESENEKKFLSRNFKSVARNAASSNANEFISALQSGNIIHFSSHAVANDSQSQNFLVLKEKLYLGQLQYITANCPLLVLAACETGAGKLKHGEGLESLGRSFASKGVDGVISTRWPVDDEATAAVMQLFYKNLRDDGRPANALQLARQSYIRSNPSVAAKNPWLWAAFTYQGINENIQPASKSCLWIAPLAVLLSALAFIYLKRFSRR